MTRSSGAARGSARALVAATSEREVYEAAVAGARGLLDAPASWLAVRDGEELAIAAHAGLRSADMPRAWRLPLGGGIGGQVAVDGEPLVIRDYRHDPRRLPGVKSIIDREGMCSGVVAPLHGAAGVEGVLYVGDRVKRVFGVDDVASVVAHLADVEAALAAVRARRSLVQRCLRAEAEAAVCRDLADVLAADADLERAVALVGARLDRAVTLVAPGAAGAVGEGAAGAVGEGAAGAVGEGAAGGVVPVRAGGEVLARLAVAGPLLDAEETAVAEAAARVLALELLRRRAALLTELQLDARLLDDLLAGGGEELVERARVLGVTLGTGRAIACVGLHDRTPLTRGDLAAVEAVVARHFPGVIATLRGGDAVLLLDTGGADDADVAARLDEVPVRCGWPLSAGVGRSCAGVADLARSHREARLALDVARRRRVPGVLTCAALGVYGTLAQALHPAALEALATRALQPLVDADAASGGDLLRTLATYLAHDRHMADTAAALFVHVNTLRNRLRRISELLGADLDDVDTRFSLELAVRARAFLAS